MAYIDPIAFGIEIDGDPSLTVEDSLVQRWPTSYQWIMQQIIENVEPDVISSSNVESDLEETIDDIIGPVNNIDSGVANNIKDTLITQIGSLRGFVTLYTENVILLPAQRQPGTIYLVASERENIDEIISEIEKILSEISSVTNALGLSVELYSEKEFTDSQMRRMNSTLLDSGGFDNDFEEVVANDVRDYLTRTFETNVTLQFGEEDPEVFEYDIFIPVNKSTRIMIEVKDASHEESDLGKGRLIDTPRDKSDIIETEEGDDDSFFLAPRNKTQSKTFVIVRGMDESKFAQHKRKADRRNIQLIKYDESGNYIETIEESLKSMVELSRSI